MNVRELHEALSVLLKSGKGFEDVEVVLEFPKDDPERPMTTWMKVDHGCTMEHDEHGEFRVVEGSHWKRVVLTRIATD